MEANFGSPPSCRRRGKLVACWWLVEMGVGGGAGGGGGQWWGWWWRCQPPVQQAACIPSIRMPNKQGRELHGGHPLHQPSRDVKLGDENMKWSKYE